MNRRAGALLITALSYFTLASAANILALLPTASPSHHIWNRPLLLALEKRGHNVTAVQGERTKGAGPNLTDLVVPNLYASVAAGYVYEEMVETPTWEWIREVYNFFGECCHTMQQSGAFKQLLDYPPDFKFDLVIVESLGAECMFGLLPRFGDPPIAMINAFGVQPWILEITGTPNFPSFMPHPMTQFTDHMTFQERAYSLFYSLYDRYLYRYSFLPRMDRMAKEYFGRGAPKAKEVLGRVGVVMSNFNPALDYAWAQSPNLVHVGGMQIGEPKPLPKELQEYMDGAPDGVIYFSLGSNVRSDKLPLAKQKEIVAAFRELPQRVLWKFESDPKIEIPPNVKISKWLPQTDILAHPKLRLFISHSGGLSTDETIHRAVPIVGIPFLVDQHINIRKLVRHGAGVLLEFKDLTKETLLKAVRTALHPSYKENMKALSEKFRDYPMTPLERAVFWTEFVIRHKGAKHLQPASRDMNLIQYLLLDVIAAVVIIPLLLVFLLKLLCHRKKYRNPKKQKQS